MKQLLSAVFARDFNNRISVQSIRFILVGSVTFTFDFFILVLFIELFEINYFISAIAGFISGSVLNYILSINWVFKSEKFRNRYYEFSYFILFTVLGLLLNQLIMYCSVELLVIFYPIAKIISLIIVTIFNYTTKKYLVFRF